MKDRINLSVFKKTSVVRCTFTTIIFSPIKDRNLSLVFENFSFDLRSKKPFKTVRRKT